MSDRGSELVDIIDDDGTFIQTVRWKRCEIHNCPNLVCHWRSKRFCYPHSEADKEFTEQLNAMTVAPTKAAP